MTEKFSLKVLNTRKLQTTPENDTSPINNTCPECGLQCKNTKGLKIHRSSKHKTQFNKPTLGFWPCKSDPRCPIRKEGHFSTSITSHYNSKTRYPGRVYIKIKKQQRERGKRKSGHLREK